MKMRPDERFGPGAFALCMVLATKYILVHKELSTLGPGRTQTVTGRPDWPGPPTRHRDLPRVLCAGVHGHKRPHRQSDRERARASGRGKAKTAPKRRPRQSR